VKRPKFYNARVILKPEGDGPKMELDMGPIARAAVFSDEKPHPLRAAVEAYEQFFEWEAEGPALD
jgi:hypothetical protein